ncbi:hypothetical protein [uncultured Tateyamaria sp.]|uniref:hypothetical protein n=1 Tax=uncultured Tateyamaria sp. TaxID=455651 RepID=UPI0026198ACC|nr:hypothetical protein [uncultured Tateyamaria sp.]
MKDIAGTELLDEDQPVGQEDQSSFTIPYGLRLLLLGLSFLLLVLCVAGVFLEIFGGLEIVSGESFSFKWPEPRNTNFLVLLPVSLIGTILLALPWEREDVRITQIGPIALERKIEGQAREQEIELAEIQDEIEDLRGALKALQQTKVPSADQHATSEDHERTDITTTSNIDKKIMEFLSQYDRWAFSPSRIRSYGSKQVGFETLGSFTTTQIRFALRRLVQKNQIVTRVSKKGNTLYRAPT